MREALQGERLRPTAQSLALATDLSLAAPAKARLLIDPRPRGLRVVVTAAERKLTVSGTVDSEALRAAALEIVRGVPGVADVSDEILMLPRRYAGA